MKIAIIGAGQMGGYYANNLVTKCGFPAGDVVCFDRLSERSQALGQKYEIIAADSFPTGIDAAIVATNTPSHQEVVLRLIDQGVQHILVEKPLAQNFAAARAISLKCPRNTNIYTALVINFSPALERVLELMRSENLILLDFYGRWGKNRGKSAEKRPTAGDLEDEAVHMLGVMFSLLNNDDGYYHQAIVSAQVGWLPYVNEESQKKAHGLDESFPLRPNHSTSANLVLQSETPKHVVKATIHSSFLLAQETRVVGGLLGSVGEARYAFEVNFDQKRPEKTGGAVDILTLVNIREDVPKKEEFAGDKLNDLTQAFLAAVQHGRADHRLTSLNDAEALVEIADKILCSDAQHGAPQQLKLA